MLKRKVFSVLTATVLCSGIFATSGHALLNDIEIIGIEDVEANRLRGEGQSLYKEYDSIEEYNKRLSSAPHTYTRPNVDLLDFSFFDGLYLPAVDFGVYEDSNGTILFYLLSDISKIEDAQEEELNRVKENYLSYLDENNLSEDEFTFQDFLDYRNFIDDILYGDGLEDILNEAEEEMEREAISNNEKKQAFESMIKEKNLEGKIIRVELNGEDITYQFDELPELVNGRTMVPMRAIFESLGASVEWNAETRSITAEKTQNMAKTVINLKIGSKDAHIKEYGPYDSYFNENTKKLDVPPAIKNNRTMVPLRFVSESLGAGVLWDNVNRKVLVFDSPGPAFIQERDRIDRANNLKKYEGHNGPLDSIAMPIKLGDSVSIGLFRGTVVDTSSDKVRVFWDKVDYTISNDQEAIDKWSALLGVRFLENQWLDSNQVKVGN